MKKFLSMMLVAVMLVACMATMAFAAEAGQTVTITFNASGNPGFATFGAQISYDSSALELIKVEPGALCAGGMFSAPASTGTVGYVGGGDVTGDGALFTATFVVKADAAPGTYTVAAYLDTTTTYNYAGEQVVFGITGGTVTVEAPVCEHEWEVTETPATCEEDGLKVTTCVKCGESYEEVIPAMGHAWDEGVVTTPATCETDGVMTYTCANCGETYTEVIEAKGHGWAYKFDEVYHWLYCNCGLTGEKEEHQFDKDGKCFCGYDKELDDQPQTGDITPVILFTMFAAVAMAGTVVVSTKRKNVK